MPVVQTSQSLTVVVPTYRAGRSLWLGIGEAVRWRHPRVQLLNIVIVDDGSPLCAFRAGSACIGGVEISFQVNPSNLGQSRASWRGLGLVKTDWALLLEDDLVDWPMAIDAAVSRLGHEVDLVSVARPCSEADTVGTRPFLQPLVRLIFGWAGIPDIQDPTSPIKLFRIRAFPAAALKPWHRSIHEGLVVLSRRTEEVIGTPLAWDGRPSRYNPGLLLRVGLDLWPRLLLRALRRLPKRVAAS